MPELPLFFRRTRGLRFLAAALMYFLCALPASAPAVEVDHIVAAVNNEVITASELAHAVEMNIRLGGDRRDRATIEGETLDGLITRSLLVQEARRLQFVDLSDAEVSTEVENLRKRFGSEKDFTDFLADQDMSEGDLSRMLGEQLLVERFIEKKVGLFVRVSRDEAQSYFNERPAEFNGRRFPDVIKDVMALLTDRKKEQQLDQYIAELRTKAEIRINTRAATGGRETGKPGPGR